MVMSDRVADLPWGRWMKLRDGRWGIRVEALGDEIRSGSKVRVHKRDGRHSVETVDRVLWRGKVESGGTDAICAIVSRGEMRQWQDDLEDHGYSHIRVWR